MSRMVQLRAEVVERSAPDEKIFRSKSAYKYAQRQLRENGVRYQVLNLGGGEWAAVKLDTPAADVRASEGFQRAMRNLKGQRDRSARGPLARALVELGLRDASWTWAVGDTNNE